MKYRDWIVVICKVFLWILPCLLVLAIVVMLAIEPNNAGSVDTAADAGSADILTTEATADEKTTDHEDATENAQIADATEGSGEGDSVDSFFDENVQLGAIPGADDGALDDSVTGSTAPAQSNGDTNSNSGSNSVKVMDDRLDPLHPDFDITLLTYKDYTSMDTDRQRAVVEAFSSPEVFIAWYNAVKARYEAENPNIEIGEDGVIDGKDFG